MPLLARILPSTAQAICLAALLLSGTAQADLESNMNDYYGALGGAASLSPAAMYQGQSAGYFSGGGIRVRTPVNNYQLLSFQAPNLKYGCGGIDAFLGGFSFINKEQIVAMARQIGSSAISTAFYLALDSMSPELSQNMKMLQEWANKANQFNINSCEAGTKMGASLWRTMGGDKEAFCNRAKTGKGVVADEFTARTVCQTDGWDFSWVPGVTPAASDVEEQKLKQMAAGNIVWRALKSAGIKDDGLAELIMSVTGTIIIPMGDSRNPQQARPAPAVLQYDELRGGDANFTWLSCGGEYKECLNPVAVPYTNSKKLATLRERINGGIAWVAESVKDPGKNIANCPLSVCPSASDALTVLELSEYPLFALIQAEYDAGMSGDMVANEYREMLIQEITYRFFSKAATPLLTALANDGATVAGTEGMRKQMSDHLQGVLAAAQGKLNAETVKRGGLGAVMSTYTQMKKFATARYSPSLTQRLRLAQVLRR